MNDSERSGMADLFALAQAVAEKVRPLAHAADIEPATAGAYGQDVARSLGELFKKLEQVPLIENIPGDVFAALQALARIVRAARTECVAYGDMALHLARSDMFQIAADGWKALVRSKPENQGLLAWAGADEPLNERPAHDRLTTAMKPLTLLDQFPDAPDGHVGFLESVRDQVHNSAEAKRHQVALRYSNDTLASMVRSIPWAEAAVRLSLLRDFPSQAVDRAASVLRRHLSVGTVDQIDGLLAPAVQALRNALEDFRAPVRWTPAVFLDKSQELQRRLAQWHAMPTTMRPMLAG